MEQSANRDMFFGAKSDIFEKAKSLRANMTIAEKILWEHINKNKLGYRFKPQHPIDIFIVDFYCHRIGLVIEVDGEIHLSQQEYDTGRTAELEKYGLRIVRFTNNEVINETEKVINKIKKVINDYLRDDANLHPL